MVSHDSMKFALHPFLLNIAILAQGCDVVGIDEAQFFDDEIVKICDLNQKESSDCCRGWIWILKKSFGPMPALMATAGM
jgi:thymidine kinase